MRAGGEKRGNCYDRARRRAYLLAEFDPDLGPDLARCHLFGLSDACRGTVDAQSMTVDRIDPGGTYARDNIRPACRPCQNKQGALITNEARRHWRNLMEEADAAGIEWDGGYA